MTMPARLALAALLLPLGASGCATLAAAHGSTVKSDEIAARNQAAESIASAPLTACATKGKPDDSGAFGISARTDGTISVDATQWAGSPEGKQCLVEEAAKAKLPPWTGGTTSAIWAIGTKEHPAPQPITAEPAGFHNRMTNQLAELMGTAEMGPMLNCVQQNISNDAYAKITFRIVVFPDGKVAGVSPLTVDGEGRDAGFQDCLRNLIKSWTFDPFPGPGYYVVTVPVQKGVDASFK